MNLTHPNIALPFGFVVSTTSKQLKIARLDFWSSSLKNLLSICRFWSIWIARAIVVAGIVLQMRFLYSFALAVAV
jgi:hypothetical protein